MWSRDYEEFGGQLRYDGSVLEVPAEEGMFIDPQAVSPNNSIEFVKEVFNGESTLHIIACNFNACAANKTKVGTDEVHPPNPETGFEGGFSC